MNDEAPMGVRHAVADAEEELEAVAKSSVAA